MASKLLRISRLVPTSRSVPRTLPSQLGRYRTFASTSRMAVVVDSGFLSRITAAEKNITHQDEPVEGGPTAQAQSHVGSQLNSQVIHDITMGERKITGSDLPAKRGPTAVAQHLFTQASGTGGGNNSQQRSGNHSQQHSGVLDSETISKITENEAQITGQVDPVRGGPTAKAQQHAGEPITSQALHDITEGEKKVTGGERVKGGPTSAAQSELAKSRS